MGFGLGGLCVTGSFVGEFCIVFRDRSVFFRVIKVLDVKTLKNIENRKA